MAKETLCWNCQNACNSGCSWSKNFIPVEGWEATPTISDRFTNTESYHVHKCPQFKEIPPKEPPKEPSWLERLKARRNENVF